MSAGVLSSHYGMPFSTTEDSNNIKNKHRTQNMNVALSCHVQEKVTIGKIVYKQQNK